MDLLGEDNIDELKKTVGKMLESYGKVFRI